MHQHYSTIFSPTYSTDDQKEATASSVCRCRGSPALGWESAPRLDCWPSASHALACLQDPGGPPLHALQRSEPRQLGCYRLHHPSTLLHYLERQGAGPGLPFAPPSPSPFPCPCPPPAPPSLAPLPLGSSAPGSPPSPLLPASPLGHSPSSPRQPQPRWAPLRQMEPAPSYSGVPSQASPLP